MWPSYIQSALDKQNVSSVKTKTTSSKPWEYSGSSSTEVKLKSKPISERIDSIPTTKERLSQNSSADERLTDNRPSIKPFVASSHPLIIPAPRLPIPSVEQDPIPTMQAKTSVDKVEDSWFTTSSQSGSFDPDTKPGKPEENFSFDVPKVNKTVYKHEFFSVDQGSEGSTQQRRNDFVYDPDQSGINRFRPETAADRDGSKSNTIKIWGGTSDEYRYNNSESQAPKKTNVSVGDTVWRDSHIIGAQAKVEAGDKDNGASASISGGLHLDGSAGYSYEDGKLKTTAQGEVFVGVKAEAEAHGNYHGVKGNVKAEASAGAGVSGNAGLVFDPTNGVSAEVGVEAFAGAQVTVEAGAGLGDSAEVKGGVDLKAGIGVEAKADVDFGIDEVGVDLELGAALGLGADFKVDVSISPSGIIDDAGDLLGKVKLW